MDLSDYTVETPTASFDSRARYVGSTHVSNQSSLTLSDYPSSRAETPVSDFRQPTPHVRTLSETIQLFQNAVESSRAAAVKSNAESEAMESSISLNVDLKNKSIGSVPDDVVDVLKKDHGRIIGLILQNNFIKNLPPRLSECTQLTYLNLRSNHLENFPPVILTLSKLEVLDLSRNLLSSIPEDIQKMKKLRFLSIRNNRLNDLPRSIGAADHLRVIKLDGNPLGDVLWSIVNGNQVMSASPPQVMLNDSDIAVEVTQQIKNYLKEASRQTDSEMGSQSESPLETPRVSRRVSARFPVRLANGSSSDTGMEPRSPGIPKPAIPTRSKQRIFSGSNGTSQLAKLSETDVSHMQNERNRSQSESVVHSPTNGRHKRMGILSAKKLDSLDEDNRNSLHLRGTSHASALKDRQRIYKSAVSANSSTSMSPFDSSTPGIFLRRLSSVPERRSDSMTSRRIAEIARGLVYALHMFDPNLHILLSVIGDVVTPGRTNLQFKHGLAISMTKKLDQNLSVFDTTPPKSKKAQKKAAKLIKSTCTECLFAYRQIFEYLLDCTSPLITKADRRYLRTLMLVFYGSSNEAFNGILSAIPQHVSAPQETPAPPRTATLQQPPRLTLQAATSTNPGLQLSNVNGSRFESHAGLPTTSLAVTQNGTSGPTSAPTRRLRSDTASSIRSGGATRLPPMPHSALPTFARSRSNSRGNPFGGSVPMSSISQPGETYPMQGGAALPQNQDHEQVELERVYSSISTTITQCYSKMSDLTTRIELRKGNLHLRRDREVCQRLIAKFNDLKKTTEGIHRQMLKLKLNDPDTKRFRDLCRTFTSYATEWESFLTSMVPEKKAHPNLWSASDMKDLKPLHERHKMAAADARDYLQKRSTVIHIPISHNAAHQQTVQQNWRGNGSQGNVGYRQNGHERLGRGDSTNSVASPYVPSTPLSAALGAAAQATIPATTPASVPVATPVTAPASAAATTPATGSATTPASTFDRTFRGNVFERADALLNSNTLPFLRPRERAL